MVGETSPLVTVTSVSTFLSVWAVVDKKAVGRRRLLGNYYLEDIDASQVGPLGLAQTRVFVFGLFQEGQVGIGVFPEREEVLVGGAGACRVAGEGQGAGQF